MKAATTALLNYLNGFRPLGDANLCIADLFTVWLANGTTLYYTSGDLPVAWSSVVFLANSLLISGLKYKGSVGLSVDKQQLTISARATDTINGTPFLVAFGQGLLDGAIVQRERAFFSSWTANTAGNLVPVGTAIMFKGRVAGIDSIGRTEAKITVAADTVLLDIDMPRRLWSAQCTHVLYDSGCALVKGTFSANGACASGSTTTTIQWASSLAAYQQGTVVFTSGANNGAVRTVKAAGSSSFDLAYPLDNAPSVGDTFTVAQGCDHSMSGCTAKSNLANFRGYPFVPQPQIMTGPLSTTFNVTGGK